METLPDLINDDIKVLSVGLNPSLPSVTAGFYFANPRNRFWKALNACGYFTSTLEPSLKSCKLLSKNFNIGFTDLVKRPTAGCKGLNAADYRQGSARLNDLIDGINPLIIWFHGKLTCQKYVQYSADKSRSITWGEQAWKINTATVFVTPNPSPANAAYSLRTISDSYAELFLRLEGN
ncbi:MAG: mismatch-specific DNA-glycosylase [Piscirickettsiaceae bacterium]|nr:MAG: mismatch-specific DNA-glycosylase [Piscirickettsiaceae bacterium]